MKFKRHLLMGMAVAIPLLTWLLLRPAPMAPELRFTTIQGQAISLAEMRNRAVLVTFWATTCASCLEEMPHLLQLYREFHDQGLEIIGIAMNYDPPNRVVQLAQQRQLPYPIVLDTGERAARAFGNIRVTPSHILIAPGGRITHKTTGPLDMPTLRSELLAMLG